MKKTLLLAAVLVAAVSLHAQNGMHIEYKITSSKGANGSMMVNACDYGSISEFNVMLPQMPGGGINTKSLMQAGTPGVIYMINDKNKTYSETKKQEAKEDSKTYTVKKLGEETVNGYKCVHALVTEGSETQEVWNTKDFPQFEKYAEAIKTNRNMSSQKRGLALKEAGCDGVPVKWLRKGGDREGDMTMELVKLEKKNFSKADFDLPAGYTKNDTGTSPGPGGAAQMKSQQEIMSMTPEERAKYLEELKKAHGK